MVLILYYLLISQRLVLTLTLKIALAGYPARPYAELIRSDIPGPSNLRSATSSASRSSPATALGSSPIGLTAATPTKGEIFGSFGGGVSKAPECEKEKPSSTKEDRPVSAKVQKLGASPTAREPERASSPLAEALMILSPPISSKPDGGAKSPLNVVAEQSLVVMPITIWNPPLEKVQSPPRKAAELKRKKPKAKVDENQTLCSLTPNSRQVRFPPSSGILTLGGRKRCLLTRLWLYPCRGLPR